MSGKTINFNDKNRKVFKMDNIDINNVLNSEKEA